MTMKDSVFDITETRVEGDEMIYRIRLNAGHPVYQAHFPSHPITPGAILVQICVDLLRKCTETDIRLKNVRNVKFLKPHNPEETPNLTVRFKVPTRPEGELELMDVIIGNETSIVARMTLGF